MVKKITFELHDEKNNPPKVYCPHFNCTFFEDGRVETEMSLLRIKDQQNLIGKTENYDFKCRGRTKPQPFCVGSQICAGCRYNIETNLTEKFVLCDKDEVAHVV